MNKLIFRFSDFSESKQVVRKASNLKPDIGFDCEIDADIRAVKVSDSKIYVSGAIKGFFSLECSRCLFIYRHPVEIAMKSDMDFVDGAVDMGEEIRQALIMEIPMKPLCDENCPGLCPFCGQKKAGAEPCPCGAQEKQEPDAYIKEKWKGLFNNNRRK